jgi:alkaline phosphatase D
MLAQDITAMTITRRELLRRASMLGATLTIPSFSACSAKGDESAGDAGTATDTGDGTETGGDGLPSYAWEGELGPDTMFSHGVASGDPLLDAVVLWTRCSPTAGAQTAVEAFFEVALDPAFEQRVAADWVMSDNARDNTIKLDITDLQPETTYYYRFYAEGRVSPIGRTRTAATTTKHLRIAVVSCSSLGHGYFHAYRDLGERADIDLVLHLGDYIYEYGSGQYGLVREYDPPHECVTLDDYRTRYRQYRSDPGLSEAHRQHPFVAVWDDHEIANNGWPDGAEGHEPVDGPWADRRLAATTAYFEYLPVRDGLAGRLYRHLPHGELLDVLVLDTRYEGREPQVSMTDLEALTLINAPGRQLLGAEQEAWLLEQLSTSAAQWKLIAQQVMFGQLIALPGQDGAPHRPLLSDWWDGYVDARNRILQHIEAEQLRNVVVVTGDNHSSFANELTYDPHQGYDPETGAGALAVEFVTPGITSPGLGLGDVFTAHNPHTRWSDTLSHGYLVLDITTERVQCDWFHIGGAIGEPTPVSPSFAKAWRVMADTPRLIEESEPVSENPDAPALAPWL